MNRHQRDVPLDGCSISSTTRCTLRARPFSATLASLPGILVKEARCEPGLRSNDVITLENTSRVTRTYSSGIRRRALRGRVVSCNVLELLSVTLIYFSYG